jgi:hypothetical protein
MATNGHILKATRPLSACLHAFYRNGIVRNGSAKCGLRIGAVTANRQSEIRNLSDRNRRPPQRIALSSRTDSTVGVDQTSLLYLSLTRCCAAQTLRTYEPRSTTIVPIALAPHRGDPGARDLKRDFSRLESW